MTEYERQRLENIARNKARLAVLVKEKVRELQSACSTPGSDASRMMPKKRRACWMPGRDAERAAPPRRSSRAAAQGKSYVSKPILHLLEERPRRHLKIKIKSERAYSLTSGRGGKSEWWQPGMTVASRDAQEACEEAAMDRMAELQQEGSICTFKVMTESQVSGGFWCQLPKQFVSEFKRSRDTKECIPLYYKEQEWEAVWLPRPGNSAGLSGGWRGFAIDVQLEPYDCVIYILAPAPATAEKALRIEIFRARRYDAVSPRGTSPPPQGSSPPDDESVEVEESADTHADVAVTGDDDDDGTAIAGDDDDEDAAIAAVDDGVGLDPAEASDARADTAVDGDGADVAAPIPATSAPADMADADAAAGLSDSEEEIDIMCTDSEEEEEDEEGDGDGEDEEDEDSDDCGANASEPNKPASSSRKPALRVRLKVGACKSDSPEVATKPKGAKPSEKNRGARQAAVTEQPAKTKRLRKMSKRMEEVEALAAAEVAAAADAAEARDVDEDENEEESEEAYYVERIVGFAVEDGQPKFHIKWTGYSDEWNTWEPQTCLDNDVSDYKWASRKEKRACIDFFAGRKRRGSRPKQAKTKRGRGRN